MIVGFRWICSATLFVGMAAGQGEVSFNRDVRPILSDRCFGCHGPDAPARKIRLRLDSETAARSVITPGDVEKSELVRRITAESPAVRMPPAYSGLKLSDKEIQTLRSWVEQGAKWQRHWSFLPPVAGPLPSVSRTSWPRNAIDNFVLAKLENVGLQPSPEANKATLIRRVSLDLTGLPPTPAEVDAFLRDSPRTLGRRLSTGCSHRRDTARGWRSAGWMQRGMRTRMDIRLTQNGTCGAGATG